LRSNKKIEFFLQNIQVLAYILNLFENSMLWKSNYYFRVIFNRLTGINMLTMAFSELPKPIQAQIKHYLAAHDFINAKQLYDQFRKPNKECGRNNFPNWRKGEF
jgi:hypothetical protein